MSLSGHSVYVINWTWVRKTPNDYILIPKNRPIQSLQLSRLSLSKITPHCWGQECARAHWSRHPVCFGPVRAVHTFTARGIQAPTVRVAPYVTPLGRFSALPSPSHCRIQRNAIHRPVTSSVITMTSMRLVYRLSVEMRADRRRVGFSVKLAGWISGKVKWRYETVKMMLLKKVTFA